MRLSRSFSLSAGFAFGSRWIRTVAREPRRARFVSTQCTTTDRSPRAAAGGVEPPWAAWAAGAASESAPGTGSLRTIGGGGGGGRRGRGSRGRRRAGARARRAAATAVTVACGGGEASGGARARRELRDQRLRRLDVIGGVERERAHQRRRRQQRRDVHEQRQHERHPDDADGDDIVPVDRARSANRSLDGAALMTVVRSG